MPLKRILAIPGSTRKNSSNYQLIKAIAILYANKCVIDIYEGLSSLPHFNPDFETIAELEQVNNFKEALYYADGVLICTPEYAHGVPGALKNAIDWTVASCNFLYKPTALITASTDGQYGHKALMETLKVIEAKDIDRLQLIVPFIKTKVNAGFEITDSTTLVQVTKLMDDFIATMQLA